MAGLFISSAGGNGTHSHTEVVVLPRAPLKSVVLAMSSACIDGMLYTSGKTVLTCQADWPNYMRGFVCCF